MQILDKGLLSMTLLLPCYGKSKNKEPEIIAIPGSLFL